MRPVTLGSGATIIGTHQVKQVSPIYPRRDRRARQNAKLLIRGPHRVNQLRTYVIRRVLPCETRSRVCTRTRRMATDHGHAGHAPREFGNDDAEKETTSVGRLYSKQHGNRSGIHHHIAAAIFNRYYSRSYITIKATESRSSPSTPRQLSRGLTFYDLCNTHDCKIYSCTWYYRGARRVMSPEHDLGSCRSSRH